MDGIYCLTVAQTNEIVKLQKLVSIQKQVFVHYFLEKMICLFVLSLLPLFCLSLVPWFSLVLRFPSSLQSAQAQLEETKVQRDELKAEVQRLKKELETRYFLEIHIMMTH